ncbi:GIY-YIG nuclease family protein [Winogradskyella aquimaris]|uniref:GIY-YIG domain-containing protein n=1 Tax=Winogradskyella aquimaris TaxID=864074 RepID=A0ABU5EMP5_9FLAO|nr:hypothetical protein [Winogradskyella aquimaris]MDY2586790.1 hypothetical protein [Winogradskyella aquimaris]
MTESENVKTLYDNLINAQFYSFPLLGKVSVSVKQGVYIIYGSNNKVLHVGKTSRAKNGLNQRLTNHLRAQSSFSKAYLIKNGIDLRQIGSYKIIEIEDSRMRTFVEALAIGKLCPAHVGTGAKNG